MRRLSAVMRTFVNLGVHMIADRGTGHMRQIVPVRVQVKSMLCIALSGGWGPQMRCLPGQCTWA